MNLLIDKTLLPSLNKVDNQIHLLFRASNPKDASLMLNETIDIFKNGLSPSPTIINIVSDKEQIGIDELRKISKLLTLKSRADWLFIAIENAHRLTIEAQNYLLNNLEESLPKQLYMLSADYSNKLLLTTISRMHTLHYVPPEITDLDESSQNLYRASGYSYSALIDYKTDKNNSITDASNWLTSTKLSRLKILSSIITRGEAIKFLNSLLIVLYGLLITYTSKENVTRINYSLNAIENVLKSIKNLESNGNIRLNLTQLALLL